MTPTAKDFLESKLYPLKTMYSLVEVLTLLNEFGNIQWNAAIEAAVYNVDTRADAEVSYDVIDKQSILKLKK